MREWGQSDYPYKLHPKETIAHHCKAHSTYKRRESVIPYAVKQPDTFHIQVRKCCFLHSGVSTRIITNQVINTSLYFDLKLKWEVISAVMKDSIKSLSLNKLHQYAHLIEQNKHSVSKNKSESKSGRWLRNAARKLV